MYILTKYFCSGLLALAILGLACNRFDADLVLEQKSPSYVVKQFWKEVLNNNLEQARQMVTKAGIVSSEKENEEPDKFYTPLFFEVLSDTNGNTWSISECDANANIMTQVLLEAEDKNGSKVVFDFILSNQNPKKIWKIALGVKVAAQRHKMQPISLGEI